MAKKTNPPQRIHPKLIDDMEKILQTRVSLKLMNLKEVSMAKATELLTKTNGYQTSLTELKTKPERKKQNE